MGKRWMLVFVCVLWLSGAYCEKVRASDVEEEVLGLFEFSEIDQILEEITPGERLHFGEMVEGLVSGDLTFSKELLGRLLKDQLFYEWESSRNALVHLLLIVITAAIFANFADIFKNAQIAEMGFYVLYLLMITICLDSFQMMCASVEEHVTQLTDFMKVLGPLYLTAVALASGSSASLGFYQIVLLLIFLVELVILKFLLPMIHVYIMVKILNHVTPESYLSRFAELLELIVEWTLKTVLTGILGLSIIQGLLSPAVDALKRSALTRGAEAIPGVGDLLGGVSEVVLGSAILIKNGIGTAGAVICIVICLVPLIKLAVVTMMYKLAAALVEPVADKRMTGCLSSVGDGGKLLVRTVYTVGVLFLLTISVVAATTS